ncbi:MAG: hypothetical protein ABSG31_08325 [Tepidisphaeraceae bacterium]|jgi:hypothetical protein
MKATKALAVFESDDTQRFEELLEDQLSSNAKEIPVKDYMDNDGSPDPQSFDNRISNVHDDEDFVYADLVVHFEETHSSDADEPDDTDSYTVKFKLRIDKIGGEVHFEDGGYRNTTDDQDDEDDED